MLKTSAHRHEIGAATRAVLVTAIFAIACWQTVAVNAQGTAQAQSADTSKGTVKGTVVGQSSGKPLSGVTVRLTGGPMDRPALKTLLDFFATRGVVVDLPTGEPNDDRIYVNPQLSEPTGAEEEGEEGCLSLPEINAKIERTKSLKIDAQDLEGKAFSDLQSGYIARIWQHEFDHLNGTLIIDRMGALAKMAAKKQLKVLEEIYAKRKR